MSVKKQITENHGIYFITITCYRWLSLIEMTNGYDIVYKWFDYLKEQGHYINGYVIMPNHLHALIAFSDTGKSINRIIGNAKRFMAYELVKRLKQQGRNDILEILSSEVSQSERKKGKLHEVFEPSFDWKECWSDSFIEQKLDYMHNNPSQGKWHLVEDVVDYPHSSARFYLTGEQGMYEVTSYAEMADVDLAREVRS